MRVSDSGIGIAAEKQEAIFEPFIQLRESLSDREGGSDWDSQSAATSPARWTVI